MEFEVFESTFCYLQKTFNQLNISNFDVQIGKNSGFEVLFAYSFDGTNYSEFKKQEDFGSEIIDDSISLYVCIWLHRLISNDLQPAQRLYDIAPSTDKYNGNYSKIQNVDSKPSSIIITSISYNNQPISIDDIRFTEKYDIINQFPKWNFYDNQQITIRRWLDQCNAIAESYGHTVIYFKTEPVNTELEAQSGIHGIHHTLVNNVIRNVTSIKKLHICIPNNEIPQDRVIYTDWDMPLQDDFVIHIVRQKFEQAFGLKAIPNEKDYIYFPMLNKLFRVSTMQPRNGFMGVVGWYEVYLAKYEEDECVRIDKNLKSESTDMFTEITSGIEDIFGNVEEYDSELEKELNDMLDDTVYTGEKINQATIEEKKSATENFTNKLEDTTYCVSLKETEQLREMYDKRIEIASVNPDDALFPINMYNCSAVTKRSVALRYNLTDYSVNNKFSNVCNNTYQIVFDFAITGRFTSEIFDILSGNNSILTIKCKSNQIILFDTTAQTEITIEYRFDKNELYQVAIEYNCVIGSFSFKIFKLDNKQKTLVYQNVSKTSTQNSITLTNINMYGGNYLTGNIQFYIDKQKFIDDKCTPLLNTFRF